MFYGKNSHLTDYFIRLTIYNNKVMLGLSGLPGAYPGGRTPGGPSEPIILAPSELKNVALTPPPFPLNMTGCETRHCNFVNTCMSEIFIQTYKF